MVATLLRLVGIDVKRLARETAITIVQYGGRLPTGSFT